MKNILQNWERVVLAVCLALMCVLVMANTLSRITGLLTQQLRWAEEAARMLMIWMGFLACGQACKDNSHYRMTAVVEKLTGKTGRAVSLLAELISLAFLGLLAFYGFLLAWRLQRSGQLSPVMHIPMWLAYLSIPVSMADMAVHSVLRLLRERRDATGEVER